MALGVGDSGYVIRGSPLEIPALPAGIVPAVVLSSDMATFSLPSNMFSMDFVNLLLKLRFFISDKLDFNSVRSLFTQDVFISLVRVIWRCSRCRCNEDEDDDDDDLLMNDDASPLLLDAQLLSFVILDAALKLPLWVLESLCDCNVKIYTY